MICRSISLQDGFAIVLALWMLLLLAVIGASVLHEARSERAIANTDIVTNQANLLADGAINRVILSLVDAQDPLRPHIDGAPQAIRLFDQELTVTEESEAGKIDLNAAPPPLLTALFRSQGVPPSQSEDLANNVVAWRTKIDAAAGDSSANAYRDAHLPYGPRHGAFRAVSELRLVIGMTDTLQAEVAPLLTIYSHNTSVDRSAASDEVLSVLAEYGDSLAAGQQVARRDGQAAGANRAPAAGEAFTIRSVAQIGSTKVERMAIIQLGGSANTPYRVMEWR